MFKIIIISLLASFVFGAAIEERQDPGNVITQIVTTITNMIGGAGAGGITQIFT